MIQQQTSLKIYDNSGAKKAKCIKVLGGYKKKIAKVGDIIIVSIKELRDKSKKVSKIKRGDVHKALILHTKSKQINKDGSSFFSNMNSICLINNQIMPVGSRILGPTSKKLKKGKYSKFSNISLGTI